MQLWDFEVWLRDTLTARPGVTGAVTFADADVPALYGVTVTSASGSTVLVRLTRGSGPRDQRAAPAAHAVNVARVAGRVFEPKPVDDVMAGRVSVLLRGVLDGGGLAGFEGCRLFRGCVAGVVARFGDGSEIYLSVHG